MSLAAAYMFGRKQAIPQNIVYLGNVSSFITSAADMVAKSTLLESEILDFTIDGANVTFKTDTDYSLRSSSFQSTSITYYRDYKHLTINASNEFRSSSIVDFVAMKTSSLGNGTFLFSQLQTFTTPECTYINATTFRGSKIVIADLQNVTYVQSYSSLSSGNFTDCAFIQLINLDSCTTLGDSDGSTNEGVFQNIKTGCVINVNSFLQTNNGGNPDANLQYAINSRGAIVNYV